MKLPDRHFHVAQMWRTIVPRRGKLKPPASADETASSLRPETKAHGARVLCVLIPRFGLALYSKDDPHLLLYPAVLTEDETDSALILKVNGKAAKSGVAVGMTVAQAGTLCAGLIAKPKDSAREESAMQELLTLLQTIALMIEIDSPGVFFLAADGFDALYGGEQPLAERVIHAIKDFGLSVQVGIGDNPFVTRLAAELTRPFSLQVIPAGTARTFLAPLKIKHLPISEETREQLRALGIRTIAQVAAFPANELITRFGAEGALIAHLARGEDPRHFVPLTPEDDLTERLIFDDPHFHSPLILNLAEQAMTPLFKQLSQRGLGCCRLAVRLQLADRSQRVLELTVDKPTLSLRKFRQQLLHQIEQARFLDGVVEIAVAPLATAPLRTRQLDLTARADGDGAVQRTLEQRILRESLFRIQIHSAVLPEESYSLTHFALNSGAGKGIASLTPNLSPKRESGAQAHEAVTSHFATEAHSGMRAFAMSGIAGLRTFNPVRRVDVISENDHPRLLIVNRQRRRIVRCHGPWQISGRWWHDAFLRDYFEIETERGEVYLIYRIASSLTPSPSPSRERGEKTARVASSTSLLEERAGTAASTWYLQGVFD